MSDRAREILEIISEETRFNILRILMKSETPLPVSKIAERVNKDKKTVDKHLKILMSVEMVDRDLGPDNIYVYYVRPKASMLIEFLDKIINEGEIFKIDYNRLSEYDEIKIKQPKSRALNVMKYGPTVVLVILGILVGYGSRIGLIAEGDRVIKFLGMLFFFLLALIYYGIARWIFE